MSIPLTQPVHWPSDLDAALTKHFGAEIEAHTFWNVCAGDALGMGAYVTNFKTDDPQLRSEINAFIAVWMDQYAPAD